MRAFLVALTLAVATATHALAQDATLIGSTFGLEGWNQRTPSAQMHRVRVPGRATVRDPGVEFPQVSRLFDTPEGRRLIREGVVGRFVNTWIDIGPNWIEIDFDRAGSGQFATAHQNTYVFVFEKNTPIEISNARVDRRTNLPIRGQLWSRGNRLFLNVQGISYSSGSFVRIVFDVAPALGAGQDRQAPATSPRPPAAPDQAPIPVPAPSIATISGG